MGERSKILVKSQSRYAKPIAAKSADLFDFSHRTSNCAIIPIIHCLMINQGRVVSFMDNRYGITYVFLP
jgi:hypothetical protein